MSFLSLSLGNLLIFHFTQVSDGTKTVIILAGELLKQAENLLLMGLHPTEIEKGYQLAFQKAVEELKSTLSFSYPSLLSQPSFFENNP